MQIAGGGAGAAGGTSTFTSYKVTTPLPTGATPAHPNHAHPESEYAMLIGSGSGTESKRNVAKGDIGG